jgi:hypothetical protein
MLQLIEDFNVSKNVGRNKTGRVFVMTADYRTDHPDSAVIPMAEDIVLQE